MELEIISSSTQKATHHITYVDHLSELLLIAFRPHLAEIWLSGPHGSLLISKNGDNAWLMFLRHEGDAGFHSLNPHYTGPGDATLKLYISNGQNDEKPLKEWIPIEEAKRIAEHFFLFGEPAPWATWHDDSK